MVCSGKPTIGLSHAHTTDTLGILLHQPPESSELEFVVGEKNQDMIPKIESLSLPTLRRRPPTSASSVEGSNFWFTPPATGNRATWFSRDSALPPLPRFYSQTGEPRENWKNPAPKTGKLAANRRGKQTSCFFEMKSLVLGFGMELVDVVL